MNPVQLAHECVGRIKVDVPRSAAPRWTQRIGKSEVVRFAGSSSSLDDFWTHVRQRKDKLAAAPHKTEGSRLSQFDQDDRGAVILYRQNPTDQYSYDAESFFWLGSAGYMAKVLGVSEEQRKVLPDILPARERFRERPKFSVPDGPGFCIDGAIVSAGRNENISAAVALPVFGWRGVTLMVGVAEATNESERSSPQDDMAFDEGLVRAGAADASGDAPVRIKTLKSGARGAGGIPGEEAVWRLDLADGGHIYKYRWQVVGKRAGMQGEAPAISIGMDAEGGPDPGSSVPDEASLSALWDGVIQSVSLR